MINHLVGDRSPPGGLNSAGFKSLQNDTNQFFFPTFLGTGIVFCSVLHPLPVHGKGFEVLLKYRYYY